MKKEDISPKLEQVIGCIDALNHALSGFDQGNLQDAVSEMTIAEQAAFLASLKDANERAGKAKSAIGKVFDWVRTEALPETMEENDISSMKVEGVGRVTLTGDMYCSMPDKKAAFDWLEEVGADDLIQSTVNASTLKAFIMRRMKNGEEVPTNIFKITPFQRASITRA